jgi:hypothetical protein
LDNIGFWGNEEKKIILRENKSKNSVFDSKAFSVEGLYANLI